MKPPCCSAHATNALRVANRDRLVSEINAETGKLCRADLLAACDAAGVPAGPINDMEDVFNDPHVKHRGLQADDEGIPLIRPPFRFSGAELASISAAPALGEHET